MEIQYYGGNCVRLSAKKVSVVIDDNLEEIGGKNISSKATVSVYTQKRFEDKKAGGFLIDGPGEYEVSEVSVMGFEHRAHTDHEEEKTATVYRIIMKGISVGIIGHIHPVLTDEQLELLGTIDVLMIPVGDAGYTMDAKGAAKLVKAIDPKIVVPTHYEEKGIKYEVAQASVEDFFKEMGVQPESVDSLKLKAGQLPIDKTEYYQLKRAV